MSNDNTKYAQVLFDYEASYADELSIKSNHVLEVSFTLQVKNSQYPLFIPRA